MTISEIMFLVSNSILSLVTVKSLASNCTLLGLYLRLKTTLQWTLVVAQVSQMTRITLYLYQSLGINFTCLETDSGLASKASRGAKIITSGVFLALISSQGSDR